MYRRKTKGILKNGSEYIILQRSERIAWKEYINTLFKDERHGTDNNNCEFCPRILKEEVGDIIRLGNAGKASGLDGVLVELFKMMSGNDMNIIQLFRSRYNIGEFPDLHFYSKQAHRQILRRF